MDRNQFNERIRELFEHINSDYEIEDVLEQLADTCYHIAEHLRTDWRDYDDAKLWEKQGKKIDKVKIIV